MSNTQLCLTYDYGALKTCIAFEILIISKNVMIIEYINFMMNSREFDFFPGSCGRLDCKVALLRKNSFYNAMKPVLKQSKLSLTDYMLGNDVSRF